MWWMYHVGDCSNQMNLPNLSIYQFRHFCISKLKLFWTEYLDSVLDPGDFCKFSFVLVINLIVKF